jgi:hypothetical protein
VIRNCYNAGAVHGSYAGPAGGIAGSVEIRIENSYNRGSVTAPAGYAMGIGTNNGGAPPPTTAYYRDDSAKDGGWFTGGANGTADNSGARTSSFMKSDDFVRLLGDAFVRGTERLNEGYPVLKWQGGTSVSPGGSSAGLGDSAKPAVSVTAKTTVKDGEAVTVVETPKDNAIGSGEASRLVVDVDAGGKSVSKVTVEIPAAFVKQASASKSEVEIRSDVASVLLPETAVTALAESGKDIAVKAERSEEAANTYSVTVESGGTVLSAVDGGLKAAIPVTDAEASAGAVAILVHADGTEEVLKKSAAVDGSLLVSLPGSATIRIEDRSKSFSDTAADAWYAEAVNFVSARNLFTGTSETEFSPNASMTRAMLVTVLHRLENGPEAAGEAFSDVNAGQYYAAAVAWASANGIVNGLGDDTFAPGAQITREQLAAMLYRYASAQGLDVSARSDTAAFPDAQDASAWAGDALSWAVASGILTGRANPVGAELAPQGTATRAEVAAMIERLVKQAAKN